MKKLLISLITVACLATCPTAYSADTVTANKIRFSGKIVKISPQSIAVKRNGSVENIPVNEITSVSFDGEQRSLSLVRSAIRGQRYSAAAKTLNKIDVAEVRRDLVKQEIKFFKAFCAAKAALGGEGKIVDAGRIMGKFAKDYPNNYRYYEANEIIGDLLTSLGRDNAAAKFYSKLTEAPWPDYKTKANIAAGRALLAAKNPNEAIRYFEKVLAGSDKNTSNQKQRLEAEVGKARCLAEQGELKKAKSLAEKIIREVGPEETDLNARAYNTLGTSLKKLGKKKEALIAFLHVDILYSTIPDAHAEALYNLIQLWNDLNNTERANSAQQTLNKQYKNSRWAKK